MRLYWVLAIGGIVAGGAARGQCPPSSPLSPGEQGRAPNGCVVHFLFSGIAGEGVAIRAVGFGFWGGLRLGSLLSYPTLQLLGPSPQNTLLGTADYTVISNFTLNVRSYLPAGGLITLPATGTYTIAVSASGFPGAASTISYMKVGVDCTPELHDISDPTTVSQRFYEVSLGARCTLPVISSVPWAKPTPKSITGGYTVLKVDLETNTGPARSGVLSIGPRTQNLFQDSGETNCDFTVTPLNIDVGATGAVGSVQVISDGNCSRTGVSGEPSWAKVSSFTAPAARMLTYEILPNFNTAPRSTYFSILSTSSSVPPQLITINQAANTLPIEERFVQLLYFSFLGRLPGLDELAFHRNQGLSRSDMALNLLNSEEVRLGGRFVAGLYVGLLDRDAEFDGWLYHRTALTRGITGHDSLVTNFLNSEERMLRFGAQTNETFVRSLYQHVLMRTPSAGEIALQTDFLNRGGSRSTLAREFLKSEEFRISTDSRLLANLLYFCLLWRDPDPAERTMLINSLRAGASVRTVIDTILRSPQFALRLN